MADPTPLVQPAGSAGRLTLRQFISRWVFGLYAGWAIAFAGFIVFSAKLQGDLERRSAEQLEMQVLANRIVGTSLKQLLLAREHSAAADPSTLPTFRRLGDQLYTDIIAYSMKPLTIEERYAIRRIKRLHQEMEVMGQYALGLAARNDEEQADSIAREASQNAADLQQAVSEFAGLKDHAYRLAGEQLMRSLRIQLAGSIVVGVLLAIGLFRVLQLIHRRLAARIETVAEAARRVGEGDLDTTLPPDDISEFLTLSEAFNRMAGNLRAAHDEIGNRTQALIQSEKMSAMGRMLAGLAHELNNPLASIVGFTELMLEGEADRESLEAVHAEGLRARGIMQTLLRFARRGTLRTAPVAVAEVTDVVRTLCEYRYAQVNIGLAIEVEPGLAVTADAQALQQVLLNLVQNSFDVLNATGGLIVIRAERDGDLVRIYVEDDGPGLAQPEQVFEPFYTTKPLGSGTGLGLTLVHMLVESLGGRAFAENRSGRGARVGFLLPAAQTAPVLQSEPIKPARIEVETAARVLVVEDEAPLRTLHQRLLKRIGAVTTLAENGDMAVRLLANQSFDVVISDVRMPGSIDGFALWAWLQANQPEMCPFTLFVSGDIEDDVLTRLPGLPPERMLSKPFRAEDYDQKIRALLARRRREQHAA